LDEAGQAEGILHWDDGLTLEDDSMNDNTELSSNCLKALVYMSYKNDQLTVTRLLPSCNLPSDSDRVNLTRKISKIELIGTSKTSSTNIFDVYRKEKVKLNKTKSTNSMITVETNTEIEIDFHEMAFLHGYSLLEVTHN
jgi:hypothetical protein